MFMKRQILIIVLMAASILCLTPQAAKPQEYGKYAIGFQRGIWALYGPSVILDLNRKIGFQTIVGFIPANSETNANLGFFERVILSPITYKTSSLYMAGMVGASHWHYMGPSGSDLVEAYEWGTNYGLMGGAELDLRMIFKRFIPIFLNAEGGIEHRQTKYTTSNTYPTYGFGIHYRF
jgi:hypothetical protein